MNVLGASQYGLLAFAMTLQAYAVVIGSGGLRQVAVRDTVHKPTEVSHVFGAYLALTGLTWLVAIIIVAIAMVISRPTPDILLLAGVFAVGHIANLMTPQPILDAFGLQRMVSLVTLVADIACIGMAVLLATTELIGVGVAGMLFAGKWMFIGFAQLCVLLQARPGLRPVFDWMYTDRMLRSTWSLYPAMALNILPGAATAILVKIFCGNAAYAIYSVGFQSVTAYVIVATTASRLLHPKIANRGQLRQSEMGRLLAGHMVLLGILLAGSVAAVGVAITYLLEPIYQAAVWPALAMLCGAFVYSVGQVGILTLISVGDNKSVLWGNAVASVVTIAAGGCLIPIWDVPGAAMAWCAGQIAATIVLVVRAKHQYWDTLPNEF